MYYTKYNSISSLISIEFSKRKNDLSYSVVVFIMRINFGKKLIAKIAPIATQFFSLMTLNYLSLKF